ncbi:MAG: hypothetical protein ACOYM8_08560 [Caulobacterales bacterium]
MTTAHPMSRTSAGAVPAASATLWALGLIAAIALIYGIRFNAPPVVSLQMIADPLRSIDDIEARHLANSPLWLWLAHGLGINGFAGWVLLSTTLTGLAVAGLVAHVVATFKTDAERGLALLLLAASPIFFHLLGWSGKADALLVMAFLGLLWAPNGLAACLCAGLMVLALPVEAAAMIALTLMWKRPSATRAAAIAGGAAIGFAAHSVYLFALGDIANYTMHAKGFLAADETRPLAWTLGSLVLEFGWFWLILAVAALRGLLRRTEIALLLAGALVCLYSAIPERPAALATLPFVLMVIERIVAERPRLGKAALAGLGLLALAHGEIAWRDGAVHLHTSHWPATIEEFRQWAHP